MAGHSTNGAAPLPAAGGSRRAVFVISLICAAQFVLQLDFSVVNVALHPAGAGHARGGVAV